MKALIVIVIALVTILLSLIMTASHWWKKSDDIVVTSNGQSVSNASVYRSPDNRVLVHLEQSEDMYVILPESHEIGIPNRSNFFIFFGYAYSRNVPPLLAPMGKGEVDPQLVVEREAVEFNATNNYRVRLTWPNSK